MSVTLSSHAEALLRQRIEAGSYRDVDELIEDALQELDERDRLVPGSEPRLLLVTPRSPVAKRFRIRMTL
jgi:Arc/MetJ-type ribon-helix-helix transcriptional regulator